MEFTMGRDGRGDRIDCWRKFQVMYDGWIYS